MSPVPAEQDSDNIASGVAIDLTVGEQSVDRDFDAFFRSHRDEIARALAFTVGSTQLAEDAVDEAMARAFQRWNVVGQYESPAGWVYRTALNWARSWRRSAFRRARREERVARRDRPIEGSPDDRPDLQRALQGLSIDQRAVVVLRHYCDWSVTETADALGVSEGTVKSRTARALDALRVILQDEGIT